MSTATTELLRSAYAGNLTTLRSVQRLGGWTNEESARRCLVSPQTFRRWRSDRKPNPTAVRLLAIEAGYLPWPDWCGWEMHSGLLFPPGVVRGGITPGQAEGLPFLMSLTRELQRHGSTIAKSADGPALPIQLVRVREAS